MLICPQRPSTLRYSFPALQQNYTQWRAYHQKKESALHYLFVSHERAVCQLNSTHIQAQLEISEFRSTREPARNSRGIS